MVKGSRAIRQPSLSVRIVLCRSLCSLCLCVSVVTLLGGGCAKKERVSRPDLKEQARQIVKEEAPPATVRVTGGEWSVEDAQGRPVLTARIRKADATVQPDATSEGPVALQDADLTLYKEGKPSLWLKAPVTTWQAGLLTASRGARCGSVDGKLALQGVKVTWRAGTDLLTVTRARCELREPSRPAMVAQGPTATWQNGLLTLPSSVTAVAADRSSSVRADRLRWRPSTHKLEATGRVRMTRGRLAGAGERLLADTTLRGFWLSGGRPRVTFYSQPAPLVAVQSGGSSPGTALNGDRPVQGRRFAMRGSWLSRGVVLTQGLVALAAFSAATAPAQARPTFRLPGGVDVFADRFDAPDPDVMVSAIGKVEIRSSQGILRASRVDLVPEQRSGRRPAGTPVRIARATGNVQIVSQSKPDQRMEATGAAATYRPGTQKAELTGGVTVTMTSPQLKEPAVLTGAQADIDLAQRWAEVTRTSGSQVALRLQPKEAASPVRLDADRVRLESAANRVTATGSPVLTSDEGTVRAQKIWFDIDPQANNVKQVNAQGTVRIDSKDPQQGEFHATAQQAVLNQATQEVVLTGAVRGRHTRPNETEPTQLEGEELTYNLKTGGFRLGDAGERRARVTVQPKPKAAGGK